MQQLFSHPSLWTVLSLATLYSPSQAWGIKQDKVGTDGTEDIVSPTTVNINKESVSIWEYYKYISTTTEVLASHFCLLSVFTESTVLPSVLLYNINESRRRHPFYSCVCLFITLSWLPTRVLLYYETTPKRDIELVWAYALLQRQYYPVKSDSPWIPLRSNLNMHEKGNKHISESIRAQSTSQGPRQWWDSSSSVRAMSILGIIKALNSYM